MSDDGVICDYCGDGIDGTPVPVTVTRGLFIFKSQEVRLFCNRRHALAWARDAT